MGEDAWDVANSMFERSEYETAARLLRPLAEQGDARAQFSLGYLYSTGQGVSEDQREAVNWISKAAEQAYPQAQYAMGCHCAQGKGVAQDYLQAYVWFSLAADNGEIYKPSPTAAFLRDSIGSTKLTPEQIKEAQQLAAFRRAKLRSDLSEGRASSFMK
jgi:uncharacterized protein